MPRNISKNDTKELQGLVRYLLLEDDERKRQSKLKPPLNISLNNKRTRKEAKWAVRYLTLFLHRQPEEEVAEVLPWPIARALIMSMLGDGSPQRSRRHHKIAQQMISHATGTMLEMLDKTHIEIISRRLREIQQDAFLVSSPSSETVPNSGYKQYREQMEKDVPGLIV